MSSKINITANAARSFSALATRIRMRGRNGFVEFRPTNRVQCKYLPEGETVQSITFKHNKGVVSGAVIANHLELAPGETRDIIAIGYGWYRLVPVGLQEPAVGSLRASR